MIQNKLTELSEKAGDRYGLLVDGFRHIFNAAVQDPDFGSARVRRQAIDQAYAMARRYLASEEDSLYAAIENVVETARESALSSLSVTTREDMPDALSALADETVIYAKSEITAQIERDIALLRQNINQTGLYVASCARAQNISMRSALIQYRVGNSKELRFYFHDRTNRKWPSRKFIRSVWRHQMLSAYNDTIVHVAADHGLNEVVIDHPSPQSQVRGKIISLAYNTGHPHYSEIKAEIFHPNTDAILTIPEAA